jgi:hypothetical protein
MLRRALWIGTTFWAGHPYGFGPGQEGWIVPIDRQRGLYVFSPDHGSGKNKAQILCKEEDFLELL